MLQRIWSSIRQNPGRVALAIAVVLGLTSLVLIVSTFINRSTVEELTVEVVDLRASLDQLRQVEQEGLRGLEDDATAAEAELAALEFSFPQLGEAFDIYRQGFALAEDNEVEIHTLETGPFTFEESPVGVLKVMNFRVNGLGERWDCLRYLGALELAGMETLALNEIVIGEGDRTCNFEVILASKATPGEIDSDG